MKPLTTITTLIEKSDYKLRQSNRLASMSRISMLLGEIDKAIAYRDSSIRSKAWSRRYRDKAYRLEQTLVEGNREATEPLG